MAIWHFHEQTSYLTQEGMRTSRRFLGSFNGDKDAALSALDQIVRSFLNQRTNLIVSGSRYAVYRTADGFCIEVHNRALIFGFTQVSRVFFTMYEVVYTTPDFKPEDGHISDAWTGK